MESCADEEITRCEPERKSREAGETNVLVRECTVKTKKDRQLTEDDVAFELDEDDLGDIEDEEETTETGTESEEPVKEKKQGILLTWQPFQVAIMEYGTPKWDRETSLP